MLILTLADAHHKGKQGTHLQIYLNTSVLVYEYIVLQNPALNHYFCTILQLHNLPVDCVKELFKPSKDSASLLV